MKLLPTRPGSSPAMTILCIALSFAAASSLRAADALSEDEKKAGFTAMFNGKDFTGWRFVGGKDEDNTAHANWKAEDGVIHLTGGGKPHLASEKEYANFEMRFEWKALKPNYNSGFYIRSGKNLGSNQLNLAKGRESDVVGGKFTGAKPVPELQNKPGEWNEWRVLVEGNKVTFWCNGKLAWEATAVLPEKGYVGLQAEGAAIDFRNLRIREIGR